MEWTEEAIARLKELWKEGLSTAEIGRRMGVTKNAVVGKAHRLVLSSRPSPIRRDVAGLPPRRADRPMRALPAPRPPSPGRDVASVEARAEVPAIDRRPALRQVPTFTALGRVSPCCWPIGEPGTKSFHFCDADTLPNKPYCAEHAQVAYVRVRDRRDSAA